MDPLALLPFALAASGGCIGPLTASQLVSAGTTLLQRSAPLVRALAGRRSGILLPNGPSWLLALAASDGRAAVVLDPAESDAHLAAQCHTLAVGAVFTTSDLASRLAGAVPLVLLDDAPAAARLVLADREQFIDLGNHYGLDLVGDTAAEGADEPCLRFAHHETAFTHRVLLAAARTAMATHAYTPVDRTLVMSPLATPSAVVYGVAAPLLAGGWLHLPEHVTTASCRARIEGDDVTLLVGTAPALDDLARDINARPLVQSALKRVISVADDSRGVSATVHHLSGCR